MKTYELVIEQTQPTCGGRAPKKCEVRTVTTDDPLAYVQSLEPGATPVLLQEEGSILVYRVDRNDHWARYEFTEE